MSETKFTPGPWHANWQGNTVLFPFVWQKGGFAIAKMCGKPKSNAMPVFSERDLEDPEKVKANANLIAAAPEMYALLSKYSSCINYLLHGVVDDPVIGESENIMIEIEELLKKARGQA